MRRRTEIPAIEVTGADLGNRLDGGGARPVRHPHRRLARGGVAEPDFRAAVAEKAKAGEGRLRWDELVGTLRHLLQRWHLTLGDRGPHLHPGFEVLRPLPFLLLARHLLDLRPK